MTFALDNNFLQFLSRFYQHGTSMGAPWAPAYACLHLGLWEEDLVYISPMYLSHIHTWLRYIDDVFVIWRGDEGTLKEFMETLNVNDRNIKLTYVFDCERISFLDLSNGIRDLGLSTHTFRKKTSANTLLKVDSHHPKWLKDSILIDQLLHIKRNRSSAVDYRWESDTSISGSVDIHTNK